MYHLTKPPHGGQDEAEKHRTEAAVKVSSQACRAPAGGLTHGVSIAMGVPQARWMVFIRENPNLKWMGTGGSPMTQESSNR